MKVAYYQTSTGLWVCAVLAENGALVELGGWGYAECGGATRAEARATLQKYLNDYLNHTQGRATKALNLVTRSKP